jgi:hypothetical protein
MSSEPNLRYQQQPPSGQRPVNTRYSYREVLFCARPTTQTLHAQPTPTPCALGGLYQILLQVMWACLPAMDKTHACPG